MHVATLLPRSENFTKSSAGAVSLYVKDFASYSKHKHSVLGRQVDKPFFKNNFYNVSLKKFPWQKKNLAYASHALHILKKLNPNQVDIHNRVELFLRISKFFKANIYFHNDPLTMRGSKTKKQRQKILQRANRVFCVSNFIKERFLDGIEDAEKKVHVMPNGIKLEKVESEKKEKTILFVGRLIEEKGVSLFVDAAIKIAAEISDWRFLIIGANRPGNKSATTPYEELLLQKIEDLSPQMKLQFFTPYEEVMLAFEKSMITVVPSLWDEPFGRTALEALASKSALITTGRGGLIDICKDVAIIDQGMNANSLSDALLYLAKDKKKIDDLTNRGYQKAQEKFSMDKLAERIDGLR